MKRGHELHSVGFAMSKLRHHTYQIFVIWHKQGNKILKEKVELLKNYIRQNVSTPNNSAWVFVNSTYYCIILSLSVSPFPSHDEMVTSTPVGGVTTRNSSSKSNNKFRYSWQVTDLDEILVQNGNPPTLEVPSYSLSLSLSLSLSRGWGCPCW